LSECVIYELFSLASYLHYCPE